MLKRMRFRNWRSLRDVEIDDLTPITVFIGANSSGKSNILDAMDFTRRILRNDSPLSVYFHDEQAQARTRGVPENEAISLEYEMKLVLPDKLGTSQPTYQLRIGKQDKQVHFWEKLTNPGDPYSMSAADGTGGVKNSKQEKVFGITNMDLPEPTLALPALAHMARRPDLEDIHRFDQSLSKFLSTLESTYGFMTQRWQLLAENFMPEHRVTAINAADASQMDKAAHNTVLILDFMRNQYPGVYAGLEKDLTWLLDHVKLLHTATRDYETRLMLFEIDHSEQEAPTISAGTSRLIAMLTAYYSLDMRSQEMPGLVFIEEPDMAVHPLLLKNFVELLRTYTERDAPRQFILTTHNPLLLDYFKPEEVRIVRRDEHGYTTIDRVPEHIDKIWLDKYGLGEVWMTRSLGDVE